MMPAGLKKVSDTVWELPRSYKHGMVVPAWIYATEKLIRAPGLRERPYHEPAQG
jgi:tRNA-splicing ligase RtcB (3'-phosphate/5'-hydroxy nucleic acid ligase)